MLDLARRGPAPLAAPSGGEPSSQSIAAVVPSFRRGSGGHATIVRLLRGLRELGHTVTVWLEDCEGRHARESAAVTRSSFEGFFAADGLELQTDFAAWSGADVVLATGWQTVSRVMLLEGARARAYLVQDHEPDFYGASAEAGWAEATYRMGIPCIAASRWLAALLRERYGARAAHFDLAADGDIYRPDDVARRDDLVIFYARAATPRRAVPLGLLALAELARRRPQLEIALYGEAGEVGAPFAHRSLGILEPAALARLYSEATVGIVLSLTNPSLVNLEMMACGLACVELASKPMVATFRDARAPVLSAADPLSLCEATETLLDDASQRADTERAGRELARARTWSAAANQVHGALASAVERGATHPAR
jgi:glycosyltransferase involved in cell wall biosynthesis